MTWLARQDTPEVADAIWSLQNADSPLTVLRALADLRDAGAMLVDRAVAEARAEQATWDAIAQAMRVSRQAVHRRYGSTAVEPGNAEPLP